jgi:hypothetical protein
LCAACIPQPADDSYPEIRLEVVAIGPVLAPPDGPGALPASDLLFVPVSQLAAPSPPLPAIGQPGKRRRKRRPTFQTLLKKEPRLGDLLSIARSLHDNRDPVFCATAIWGGYAGFRPGLKALLGRLVGWTAETGGDLRSWEAYEVAYKTIYLALPDCRGRCWCSSILS